MRLFLLIFILIPIIEIGVFIQVGDTFGLTLTLIIVLFTAIIGVNLLKQQGLKTKLDIQNKMALGQTPAVEMASAVQVLIAGCLLLTPGFMTDIFGFILMIPYIRALFAQKLFNYWTTKLSTISKEFNNNHTPDRVNNNRTIEGEYEDHSN